MFHIDWDGLDTKESTGICTIVFGDRAESFIFYNYAPFRGALDIVTSIIDCAKHYEDNEFEDVVGEYSNREQAEKWWEIEKQCSEKLHNLFTDDEFDFITCMVGYE